MKEAIELLTSNKDILLNELTSYGSVKAKEKGKYSCPLCSSTNALSIKQEGNKFIYKCFSCQGYGDVINLVSTKENIENGKSIVELANRNNINLPKSNIIPVPRVDKKKIAKFYESETEKALKEGDIDKAFEISNQGDKEAEINYILELPFRDTKNNPHKIWENLDVILKKNNIYPVYNQITKNNEIKGLGCDGLSNQIMDIHSLASKYGFKVSLDFIGKAVSRIAERDKYNPVEDYLLQCRDEWDEKEGRIDKLCDTLQVPEWFSKETRNKLVTKWLLNVANIPFNEGDSQAEGALIIQGSQGIGKTTWIKKLIPLYLKTGLELDPSDKDKVYNCIKYWVVELGELDATMKADQAKLKAFLTESVDEIRRPYAIAPEAYPRKTAFYGTVNKSEFLKDETGDRRYWVIPVNDINIKALNKIDINQLWGEIVHLLKAKELPLYLTKEELKEVNESNKDFRVKGALQIAVENRFQWNMDKSLWKFMKSSEIADKLNIKTTVGLKEALESMGAEYKKTKGPRGYIVPPFKDELIPLSSF